MAHGDDHLLQAAREYRSRGYAPIPVPAGQKGPTIKGWPGLVIDEPDLARYFNGSGNIGLLLGRPSGGLVDIDLDCDEAVELAPRFLPPTPTVTGRRSRPGSHWWYVCPEATTVKHKDPVTGAMIVELRSTGSQTVVGPSTHPDNEPYDRLTGTPAEVDVKTLMNAVAALAEAVVRHRHGVRAATSSSTPRPASDVSHDERVRRAVAYVNAMPEAISGQGGHDRTYAAATAVVHGFDIDADTGFSILWEHFNPRCAPPWSEKELRHKVEDAASKPHDLPRGWLLDAPAPTSGSSRRSRSGVAVSAPSAPEPSPSDAPDPGPLPEELLRVPGFINEVMDATLQAAPYPNPTVAFAGALALQAMLAGRKVRDPGDNRTNLYILALAHSAAGKDSPRKMNARILHEVGLSSALAQQIASGEGLQDALMATPSMLVQTDEFDTVLQAMKTSRDGRYESMMATLLSMYSSASTFFPMRRKANEPEPGVIDQPNLVLFGTAIPNHYYEALSERMLTNGLFARMLIFESPDRGRGQEPGLTEPPTRVLETARWWVELRAGTGNLALQHPSPLVVPQDDEARRLLSEQREQVDDEYDAASRRSDAVATTVWGRVNEMTRKLALLYAISENHMNPTISGSAVGWAGMIAIHQARRMLTQAAEHAAESPFDDLALRALRKLKMAKGTLPHSVLLKRMKLDARTFGDVMETLEQRGDVVTAVVETSGRPRTVYHLPAAVNEPEGSGNAGGAESGLAAS